MPFLFQECELPLEYTTSLNQPYKTLVGAPMAKMDVELLRACPAAASRREPANPAQLYAVYPTASATQSPDDVSRSSVCPVRLQGDQLGPSEIFGVSVPS